MSDSTPTLQRPTRSGWAFSELASWLLGDLFLVLLFGFGLYYLGNGNQSWIQSHALQGLILLQMLVCLLACIARLFSTWQSGIYEWLMMGSLLYFIKTVCEFLSLQGAYRGLELYSAMALFLAMGCFFMASLQMKALARRYGFLSNRWTPKAILDTQPPPALLSARPSSVKSRTKNRRSRP